MPQLKRKSGRKPKEYSSPSAPGIDYVPQGSPALQQAYKQRLEKTTEHDRNDPIFPALLPRHQQKAELKVRATEKRIGNKVDKELSGLLSPKSPYGEESRNRAKELAEKAKADLLTGAMTWRDFHETGKKIRSDNITASIQRKKAKAEPQTAPTPAPEAPEATQGSFDMLYQGHRGPGIGHLKEDMPERRDGDKDTVVAERRPRKSDDYTPSPTPVPQHLRPQALVAAEQAQASVLTRTPLTREEAKRVREIGARERHAIRKGGEDASAARVALAQERTEIVRTANQRQQSLDLAGKLLKKKKETKPKASGTKRTHRKADAGLLKSGMGSMPNIVVKRR